MKRNLCFSISSSKAKKKPSINDDCEFTLKLAPFSKVPKLNLGSVVIGSATDRCLFIMNPHSFKLKLSVKSEYISMENTFIYMQPMSHVNFCFKWMPDRVGNYNFFISFEVKQKEVKLKYLVSVNGICIKELPKEIRHFKMFQPILNHSKSLQENENQYAVVIQKNIRMYLQKKKYLTIKNSAIKIQRWLRANSKRLKHLQFKRIVKKHMNTSFNNDVKILQRLYKCLERKALLHHIQFNTENFESIFSIQPLSAKNLSFLKQKNSNTSQHLEIVVKPGKTTKNSLFQVGLSAVCMNLSRVTETFKTMFLHK